MFAVLVDGQCIECPYGAHRDSCSVWPPLPVYVIRMCGTICAQLRHTFELVGAFTAKTWAKRGVKKMAVETK